AEDRDARHYRAFLSACLRSAKQLGVATPTAALVIEDQTVPALERKTPSVVRQLLISAASARRCAPDLRATSSIGREVDVLAVARKAGNDVISRIMRDLVEPRAGRVDRVDVSMAVVTSRVEDDRSFVGGRPPRVALLIAGSARHGHGVRAVGIGDPDFR